MKSAIRHRSPTHLPVDEIAPPDVVASPVFAAEGAVVIRPALVQRAEWTDPSDMTGKHRDRDGRLRAKTVYGWRRVSTLFNLHQRSPSDVTARHLLAAAQLTRDFEVGKHGARAGGGIGSPDGAPIVTSQIRASIAFDAACAAMTGRLSDAVVSVVIGNLTIEAVARVLGISVRQTRKRLIDGLDALVEHYTPPTKARPRISVAQEAGLVDPDVLDIPQDRLGRSKKKIDGSAIQWA